MSKGVDGFPCGVAGGVVTCPFYKEVHLAAFHLVGQNRFDLILDITIDDLWLWRREGTTTEVLGGGFVGFEPVHMKYVVDAHCWGELNLEGDWGALLEECERTKKPSLQRGCRAGRIIRSGDVLRTQKDLVTDFIVVRSSMSVSILYLAVLGLEKTIASRGECSLLGRDEGIKICGCGSYRAED
jgi:hypothetical protein